VWVLLNFAKCKLEPNFGLVFRLLCLTVRNADHGSWHRISSSFSFSRNSLTTTPLTVVSIHVEPTSVERLFLYDSFQIRDVHYGRMPPSLLDLKAHRISIHARPAVPLVVSSHSDVLSCPCSLRSSLRITNFTCNHTNILLWASNHHSSRLPLRFLR